MPLFQASVLKNYLKQQDHQAVSKAYKKYSKYFLNPATQENIRNSKEEEFQALFLNELFVKILGYTIKPSPGYNLTTEFKNETNTRKADGAIVLEGKAIGVVELKGTKTKELESIRKQAFDYKVNNSECVYVITSNFEKLRFYIEDASNNLDFNLFTLSEEEFSLMHLCLQKDNILNDIPRIIKQASVVEEEKITKGFYNDYSLFKRELYRDLVKQNGTKLKSEARETLKDFATDDALREELERIEKNVKLSLFKKSQKLIDRFLFIFFAEDRGLLPPNFAIKIIRDWKGLREQYVEVSLYERFKLYFNFLDKGRKGEKGKAEVYAYNGGLFKPDSILDSLLIDDEMLSKHTERLANYDFESQVDVNILGHIFENSLNEIESVNAEIEGSEFDKQKSKRKKDGVFYTPSYITKYIVENTVGKLCDEKKKELAITYDNYKPAKQRSRQRLENLEQYREWLLQLTICDPACGSGAFLNQALDYLINEHNYIDELSARYNKDNIALSNIEHVILENNIYGVDLNEESVEIAKLSLWLRTAQPRRKLSDLSNNIKCGNSLIESKSIAGHKAFNWQEQFPMIFKKGGFDVIIGNPPYGDYFTEIEKVYLLKRYSKSFSGTFDMYIFFFEVSINILKQKGILCFITPNTFVDYSQFSGLRGLLKLNNNIEQIVGLTKVFEDAIVDTAIISLIKDTIQASNFYGKIFKSKLSSLNAAELNSIPAENLLDEGFIIKKNKALNVFKILKNSPHRLSDKIKITQGITTGGNPSFINDKSFFEENGISNDYIHPVLKGKTISRHQILFDDEYILYSTKKTDKKNQEKIAKVLSSYEIKLSKKRETKKGTLPWYCLHWSRNENDFNEPKILIRQTASEIIGVLDTSNFYPIDSIHTLNLIENVPDKEEELRFLLGILNSKFFKFLYNWKLDESGKVYPQIKKVNIEWLPLPSYQPSDVVELSKLVSSVIPLYSDCKSCGDRFIRYLLSRLDIEKTNVSLENWEKLDFNEFIKELNKAIKTTNKEREKEGLEAVATLSKLDEMEWMDAFETKKKEAQELQSQIVKIEKEIDAMVYHLYGLTEEEIRIVEEA